MKLGGKISRRPRSVIDVTGTDLLCWVGRVNSEKSGEMRYF